MMCVAVVALMIRFVGELVLSLKLFFADSVEDLLVIARWTARSELLAMAALALLAVGVASNLGELRRRRWPLGAALFGLGAFAVSFAIHAWLYDLVSAAAASGFDLDHEELAKLPLRSFLATAGLVGGLFATVRLVRAYAMTESNLGLREQARNIGGMLLLLPILDTFYRYSYGLGVGLAYGPYALIIAGLLFAFWLWCFRQTGALFVSVLYYLRVAQDVPLADVVTPAAASLRPARPSASPPAAPSSSPPSSSSSSSPSLAAASSSKPALAPPPAPVTPIEPTASVAPASDEPTPIDGGPRFLS